MELKEDIKKIIDSIAVEKEKVLILDRKENFSRWEGFKCLSYDDIQSIKDNFDVVIVNDVESLNLEELSKFGGKFIILNHSFNEKLVEKSDEILDKITSENLNDEMEFLDKILGKKEKFLEKKKLSYVVLEKEDLISKPNFFFNLALIQNLKKQMAEKEKVIASQKKDIEILESNIKHLECWVNDIERKKDLEVQKIENLKIYHEQYLLQYEKRIENLKKDMRLNRENLIFDFGKQLEEKEHEIERMRSEFEINLRNLQINQDRLIKNKDEEIKKLSDILNQIKNSLTFKIASSVTKRISKVKKW